MENAGQMREVGGVSWLRFFDWTICGSRREGDPSEARPTAARTNVERFGARIGEATKRCNHRRRVLAIATQLQLAGVDAFAMIIQRCARARRATTTEVLALLFKSDILERLDASE